MKITEIPKSDIPYLEKQIENNPGTTLMVLEVAGRFFLADQTDIDKATRIINQEFLNKNGIYSKNPARNNSRQSALF